MVPQTGASLGAGKKTVFDRCIFVFGEKLVKNGCIFVFLKKQATDRCAFVCLKTSCQQVCRCVPKNMLLTDVPLCA